MKPSAPPTSHRAKIARSVSVVVALLAIAAPAAAGPPAKPKAAGSSTAAKPQTPIDQAKALTAQAELEYKVGHFQLALNAYSSAYEIYPTPALLFNIGQCHKLLKNHERAVFFFRGYLRDKPDAPNRAQVEGLLADSQRALDEEQAQAKKEAAEQERVAEEQRRAAAEAQSRADAEASGRAAPPPPPPPKSPVFRITGLAVAGAGLVAIGTGVYFGLKSHSAASDIQSLSLSGGTWSPAYQSLYSDGQSEATIATALYVAGGVAAAAGGFLLWYGWPRQSAEAAPTASFAPVPGGGAFVVRGGF